ALTPGGVGGAPGPRRSTTVFLGWGVGSPASGLISGVGAHDPAHRGGVLDGVLAGLGFGLLFVCLGQVGDDAGLMPLALSQLASIASVVVTATVLRQAWVPRTRAAWSAVVMGPLGAVAQGAFLYASHHGLLSVVSVISSLYPASTVVLAAVVLREKILRWQAVGLIAAALAVALVAAG
ncbi:MAG: EamA family transporter, partial [Aeromicrobium sp.]